MSKLIKIIDIIAIIILVPILLLCFIFITNGLKDKENVPNIFGYTPLIVLSPSMETQIYAGDLVIVKSVNSDDLKVGDIIAFYEDRTKSTIITHRITEIRYDQDNRRHFITRGDHNDNVDIDQRDENLVVGQYFGTRFAGLGNTAIFLQTPVGMLIVLSIPIGLLLISQSIQNRRYEQIHQDSLKSNEKV